MAFLGNTLGDSPHRPLAKIKALQNLDKKSCRSVMFAQRAQQKSEAFGAAVDRALDKLATERPVPFGIGKGAADAEFGVDRYAHFGRRSGARPGRGAFQRLSKVQTVSISSHGFRRASYRRRVLHRRINLAAVAGQYNYGYSGKGWMRGLDAARRCARGALCLQDAFRPICFRASGRYSTFCILNRDQS